MLLEIQYVDLNTDNVHWSIDWLIDWLIKLWFNLPAMMLIRYLCILWIFSRLGTMPNLRPAPSFCHQALSQTFLTALPQRHKADNYFLRAQMPERPGCVCVGGGDTQIWNWYTCATQGLKLGGLGSGPLTESGGFQSGLSREKQRILELKITQKRVSF